MSMSLRRSALLVAALAFVQIGCDAATAPAGVLVRFDVRAVPPERSVVPAVTVSRTREGVVVRGGFFVGVPERTLVARVARVGAGASRLEVSAVSGAGTGGARAANYDYEAVLPAVGARYLTVVHHRAGSLADTVFLGRVF
jgi:hypothetical protein